MVPPQKIAVKNAKIAQIFFGKLVLNFDENYA